MIEPIRRGVLDPPPSRGTTNENEYGSAFSQPESPRFAGNCPSKVRGRREDRVRAAPAVSRAFAHRERAHEHTGSAERIRPSLRNGFTAYFVLSPVNGFVATVIPEKLASHEI